MSQQNKALAHRWFEEVWNRGREETIHELLAPDAIAHSLSEPGVDARGEGDFLQFFLMMRGAFPDLKITIEDTIAEGDKVVLRWNALMTHTGEGMGVAPTHERMTITGIHIARFAGGKLVEAWDSWDRLSMMQALGLAPGAAHAAR
ncbi:MAG: ester cyclase [Bryobacteraceae bacterium]